MSHTTTNPDLLARVRRIAGQVGAVEKALIAGEPCATVLHRIAAVRGAVNGLLDEVIADHLAAHVAAPGLSEDERTAGADELLAVIRRYSK
ncbi:metal/formaldehyde-sensitive transcriptional repressor [Sphingopyxis sp. YF1]|uniref:metal/formaldehyde-sensitive transcriptional repressor n=1 Tax=Sphingopyxis sp. YF1 TaxID=2482763 RepID=UPI001F61680D|nr:metal/formaldehyde-sensitive transcriptional repressor [Sphingopyxis sp. YF1]UNU41902.1 metal/formaldehyde-sensitive transcriptional repressor [Sphingopyxis sp. YF1]